MKTSIFSIVTLLFALSFGQTQVLEYEILLGKRSIGTLKVTPTNLHSENYSIKMDAEMSLPFTSVNSVFDVKFEDGVLHKSEMVQKMNGKIKEQSTITRNGEHYNMNIDGEHKTMQDEVTYSIAKLYHFEPKHKKRVFSERFGAYGKITELEPHLYEVSLPDGNNNKYRYENGVCVEMTSKHTLSTVTFQLKNNKQAAGR